MQQARSWIVVTVVLAACSSIDDGATERFRADFTTCMENRGVPLETLDAAVTRTGELQLRGYSYEGEEEVAADHGTDCENLLLRRHGLTPG